MAEADNLCLFGGALDTHTGAQYNPDLIATEVVHPPVDMFQARNG